ncbi:hypothetical protein JD489_03865 [Aeromonas veronii]|uniref:hypothetical protein n=1 Tax=Aeromonas veronii TaxID=654 RepID=UPI00191F1E5F|nr:hypothetical protein [Aeromonas veronii]MBL0476480.1 hypothetical protein [Aeromonas veronii]
MKNWKSNLFFTIAILLSFSPILIQVFGTDSIREKNVSVAEWQDMNDQLSILEKDLNSATEILKQKTVVDGNQLQLSKLDDRVENIEKLFLSKAEIAVTIPLLKREIEMMNKELQSYKESLSTTNNIIITLIGAIIAQLAAVFFFVRERSANN